MSLPIAALAFQAALRLDGNFHEVVPGEFYRSAQLSPEALSGYIKDYGIKTVLNLRGSQPGAAWYEREKQVTRIDGAEIVDFAMSAGERLSTDKAQALVALLKAAPKPILVHCKTGADRTGLVSVIYASQVAGMDEEVAEEQLSPLYGHFGIPLVSPTFAMDMTWEDLEAVFGIEGS